MTLKMADKNVMQFIFIYGVCASFLSICDGIPPGTSVPNRFVVNLDLPEEQRWVHIVTKEPYKSSIPKFRQLVEKYLPLPSVTLPIIETIAGDLDTYLGSPYAGEIRGVAKAANISLGDMVLANILYDVSAFCTSIVLEDVNKTIWHARNLDYSFTDLLRNLTIIVDFQKSNKTVFSGVTYAGYIGLMTGQRPNGFTLTCDERDQGKWWMNILIGLFQKTAVPVSFLIRNTLYEEKDFDSAVQKLAYTVTEASAYFIFGGTKPGEGAVVTKGREGPVDIWKLDTADNRWFLVETNYDHWNAPPPSDNRRDPAIKKMNEMTNKNVSVDTLMAVLSTPPVLNDKTTYSIVMSAAQPEKMTTYIRNKIP